MDPDSKRLPREVFLKAAEIEDPGRRAAYLDEACAGDPELRRRVEKLLALEQQTGGAPPEAPSPAAGTGDPALGSRISHYKLLERIGEGGCGVVYMAEQERPVRRRVALKIIKLGMDTKQVIARFEAERQALAMMDHPNIANFIDAGATDTGRPYFVMELVRGIRITDYCDRHQLSTRQRLDLFMQVCHAVQHAHQKGSIHRDLKPSNVLVTEVDGKPVPKVIDFGIAKAIEGRLTDNTLFTAFKQLVGTPDYMSPEQASLATADIDTRTDIYSLGVMLYQLLTSETPFDMKALLAAGLDELRRTVSERKPARPSTRLTTMAPDQAKAVAKARGIEPSKFMHVLAGDLDCIVMKCLEKERGRRYATANGLAMDVQRYLNNEPIVARPPSRLYEFRKTVRRHWVGFAATAALIIVLAAGIAATSWQAFRATRAEKASRAEAAKATAVSAFLRELLRSGIPVERKGDDYTVRQLLDDASADLSGRFRNQPEVEAEVRETIGVGYLDLGLGKEALPHLERALSLNRELHGSDSQPVVRLLHQCGWAWRIYTSDELTLEQQWERAKPYLREAQETARRHGIEWRDDRLPALGVEKIFMEQLGRYAEAEAVIEEMLRVAKAPPRHPKHMAIATATLAGLRAMQGRQEESTALLIEAVELHRESGVMNDGWAGPDIGGLGHAYLAEDKLPEAKAAFEEALSILTPNNSYEHHGVRWSLDGLRRIYEQQQDWPALEEILQRILEGQRAAIEKADYHGNLDETDVVVTWFRLADAIAAQGRTSEAEHQRDLAEEFLAANPPGPDADTSKIADFFAGREAEAYYQQGLRVRTRNHHAWVLNPLRGLVHLALDAGDEDKARELALQGLVIKEEFDAGGLPLDEGSVNEFAVMLRGLGLDAEAERLEGGRTEEAN